ncbi:unnamed protein product [Prunus armeniaca]|uniref:Uncharacterized protein n=1 Tax=Prunus armeniaca TaxID=36596 RepID=A0A6J5VEG1_PRUAR|nr:unnamed protein product [Prunus armeniaca]
MGQFPAADLRRLSNGWLFTGGTEIGWMVLVSDREEFALHLLFVVWCGGRND